MKELADADVAKALGWVCFAVGVDRKTETVWGWQDPKGDRTLRLPKFTTSLDAITQEIERRGLGCSLDRVFNGDEFGWFADVETELAITPANADTAPLALCKALMAYLEEK